MPFERFRCIADAQTDKPGIGVRCRVSFTSARNFGKEVACIEIGKASISFYHKRILTNRIKQRKNFIHIMGQRCCKHPVTGKLPDGNRENNVVHYFSSLLYAEDAVKMPVDGNQSIEGLPMELALILLLMGYIRRDILFAIRESLNALL